MEASSSPPALAPVAATRYARPADLFVPSKLTSWVWQHFLQSRSHPDHAWCNVPGCPPSAQKVSRKKGNTSNMIEHLLKHHRIREPSLSSSSVSPASIREYLSSTMTAAPCSASFRTSLDTHIAQFFISSCLPFNLADNPSFIASYHFATAGSYLPPARTKLTAAIDAQYQSMVDVLLADVRNNTISITSDAATLDNGHSYIAVTAHYITANMDMRDITLLVSRMTGSHTGEYVSDLLDMTISAWEADDRCFAAVTDNGANFVKAARVAGKVHSGLRCACHTLQLALKDGVAEQPTLKQLCADAQHVVVVIRRSALLTEELQDIQRVDAAAAAVDAVDDAGDERDPVRPLKLAMNVPTRFNSMCILFTRLLEVKAAVQRVCIARSADFDGRVLSSDQWEQIAELVAVLAPVKALCDVLETSLTPSLSLLIPLTSQLVHELTELHGQLKIPSCKSVNAKVRNSVFKRMNAALVDPPTQVAMMLDPRVRTKSVQNYPKAIALKTLRDTFMDFPTTLGRYRGAQSVSLRHSDQPSEVVEVIPPEAKRAKFTLQLSEEKVAADATVSELDLYLREGGIPLDSCPLVWWRERKDRYPVLFEMARVYLAVPASSAPSERVFSAAKLVLTDKRKQLLESRVARSVFMTRNMKLYKQLQKDNTNKSH